MSLHHDSTHLSITAIPLTAVKMHSLCSCQLPVQRFSWKPAESMPPHQKSVSVLFSSLLSSSTTSSSPCLCLHFFLLVSFCHFAGGMMGEQWVQCLYVCVCVRANALQGQTVEMTATAPSNPFRRNTHTHTILTFLSLQGCSFLFFTPNL